MYDANEDGEVKWFAQSNTTSLKLTRDENPACMPFKPLQITSDSPLISDGSTGTVACLQCGFSTGDPNHTYHINDQAALSCCHQIQELVFFQTLPTVLAAKPAHVGEV